jgi:hypothetical protein
MLAVMVGLGAAAPATAHLGATHSPIPVAAGGAVKLRACWMTVGFVPASPRPSATPPATTTGIGSTASTTCGTTAHCSDAGCHSLTTGLASLGDDDVHAALGRFPRLTHRVHLMDDLRADVVCAFNQSSRIA